MTTAPLKIVLTPRQIEILTAIEYGATALEIGNALYISKRTVDFHTASIIDNCHARTAIHAVRLARDAGLLRSYDGEFGKQIAVMLQNIDSQWSAR